VYYIYIRFGKIFGILYFTPERLPDGAYVADPKDRKVFWAESKSAEYFLDGILKIETTWASSRFIVGKEYLIKKIFVRN
jgi:hypothetical protein